MQDEDLKLDDQVLQPDANRMLCKRKHLPLICKAFQMEICLK
jgi:hypothetical protein